MFSLQDGSGRGQSVGPWEEVHTHAWRLSRSGNPLPVPSFWTSPHVFASSLFRSTPARVRWNTESVHADLVGIGSGKYGFFLFSLSVTTNHHLPPSIWLSSSSKPSPSHPPHLTSRMPTAGTTSSLSSARVYAKSRQPKASTSSSTRRSQRASTSMSRQSAI